MKVTKVMKIFRYLHYEDIDIMLVFHYHNNKDILVMNITKIMNIIVIMEISK